MWADDTWLQQHAGETLKDKENNEGQEQSGEEGKGEKRSQDEAEVSQNIAPS